MVGTWNLLSCRNESASGAVEYYYGERPFGRLMYQPSGHVSVFLSSSERPLFKSTDRSEADVRERLAAHEGFDAYSGTYRFDEDGGTVEHFVEASYFPNWVNTTLVRQFTLEGDTLQLSTTPVAWRRDTWIFKLTWKRLADISD